MASLDYIDIPPAATRLRPDGPNIQPAHKILTSLPNPDPPAPPEPRRARSNSSAPSGSLAAQTMSLLIGGLPVPVPGGATAAALPDDPEKVPLLSSRDPLSLPTMSSNFRRFVAKVGPVFWFQDRVEEIVFWKRGWKRTTTWMALYAFLCYFPRMILLIPHAALIAIILSTYPYAENTADSTTATPPPTPAQPVEGTAVWQANIQAIQNLMGFVADTITLLTPYTHHLCLSPAHLTTTTITSTQQVSSPTSPTAPTPTPTPTTNHSPYTPHILTLLIVTFFPILFMIHLPSFPIRQFALLAGLMPLLATHPTIRTLLLPYLLLCTRQHLPAFFKRHQRLLTRFLPSPSILRPITTLSTLFDSPIQSTIQRIIDNERLPDECCWGAEMRQVELYENERYEGSVSVVEATQQQQQQGWSKQNLKSGERCAWTRGMDGWTGVGPEDEISSNLTFSLGPGWSFVETEDWRKDVKAGWVECGGDGDGWVYTNEMWLGPRSAPYSAGSGSVTRRRRWLRRVWYDARKAVVER